MEESKAVKDNQCFVIIPIQEGGNADVVLTIDPTDKYKPKTTGVHNVSMQTRIEGKESKKM